MVEALVVGAGPAGAMAALRLAEAGVRVLLVDRARFPREKLCGDTLNPGAVALLCEAGLGPALEACALEIAGMRVTGERGAEVTAFYPMGARGRAIMRRELDAMLVAAAVRAGARFEEGVRVIGPLIDQARRGTAVRGVVLVDRRGRRTRLPAALTIAADGRRSGLGFALGLTRHPARPRRWAVGGYFDGVADLAGVGEMHVRAGHYIGVAPLPAGVANVCVVAERNREWSFADPGGMLQRAVSADPWLRERFVHARLVGRPVSMGPLAVDPRGAGCPGLLLAGDAAGFVDPMTGDGMRFALRGGELAAQAALGLLLEGRPEPWVGLGIARAKVFGRKVRFNKGLRALVASPVGVHLASLGAGRAPGVLRALVRVAGDVTTASAVHSSSQPLPARC